jgi:hypothetical protein
MREPIKLEQADPAHVRLLNLYAAQPITLTNEQWSEVKQLCKEKLAPCPPEEWERACKESRIVMNAARMVYVRVDSGRELILHQNQWQQLQQLAERETQ